VAIDTLDGVRQAVTHLRALGHRRIAFVGGPRASRSNTARLEALRTVAAQHPDLDVTYVGSFQPDVSGGEAAADLVIVSGASAVLAYNDLVAFGLMHRFRHRGVRVPDDVSVVGVDDLPLSALTYPSLTSVGFPLVDCGRAGADMLLSVIREAPDAPVHYQDLAFRLVVRESTGPVAPVAP
jgi:LacI family transcriptional regulator